MNARINIDNLTDEEIEQIRGENSMRYAVKPNVKHAIVEYNGRDIGIICLNGNSEGKPVRVSSEYSVYEMFGDRFYVICPHSIFKVGRNKEGKASFVQREEGEGVEYLDDKHIV